MIDEKVLLQSRPEALNDKMDMNLQNKKGGYNNGWNDCLFMFIDIIKKQPKVCEWIPVSERLPEPINEDDYNNLFDVYLVSVGEESNPIRALWDGRCFCDAMFRVILGVKAWMPLPEPYKEKENE